jgi:aryl-alcohol dehydrogenase-like predicted oxidoreductase
MDHEESRGSGQRVPASELGAILSVRLDAATVRVLRELARSTGLSPAQLVQAWVRERARMEHARIPA